MRERIHDAKISSLTRENDAVWEKLYTILRPFIRRQVYSSRLPMWYGQEEDMIEDIVQETMRRTVERAQRAEREEAAPILHLVAMAIVIARNYCNDLRRRERYRVHFPLSALNVEENDLAHAEEVSSLDTLTELVYQEELFRLVAREIITFPDKQRRALLIDLARSISFEAQPTQLQQAFLSVGIHLEEYRRQLPEESKERSRYASLLHHAYKRIGQCPLIRQYATE